MSTECDLCWQSRSQYKRQSHKALVKKLGRELLEGMHCLHTCDVPRCKNPDHLYEGTEYDNKRDMVERRRNISWTTKLGPRLRVEIAQRWLFGGTTQIALAREYGVTQPAVGQYIRRYRRDPTWDGCMIGDQP